MNVVDWILVVLVVLYAVSGYWQGFVAGAFATFGLVAGGLFGIWLAPKLLGEAQPSVWVTLGSLITVLVCASVGQATLQYFGSRLRNSIRWQPVRALDAVGGVALSVVAVLLVSWMLGVAITGAQLPVLTEPVNNSRILRSVNAAMPHQLQRLLRAFDDVVGSSFFPRYLEPFAPERIVPVGPPQHRVVRDPDVARAVRAVYKIRGDNRCGQGVEGSGFLYYPGRLMTNAHVVAGVSTPMVRVGGSSLPSRVVYYDPDTDVAVLAVPQLEGPVIRFAHGAGRQGQSAAALGYPNDGPFNAQPARIRSEQRLRSPNIYAAGDVTRRVYALRSRIRPGNSGGPLVATNGRVLGVIFAASVSNANTGYALTAAQVRQAAAAGIARGATVGTKGCA